jgi:Ca2+/Na+ antiporter
MEIWQQLLIIFVLVIIATWVSSQVKKFILPKYRIKKLYVLIATILLFVAYILLGVVLQNNPIVQYIMLTIICIFMMTYFEMSRMDKEEKNKPVVGRPMAKPHRANKESK